MGKANERARRYIYVGIIMIVLGVTFSTALKERVGSLSILFIAVGGLFFIIGMSLRRGSKKE